MFGQKLGKRERTLLTVCVILGAGAVAYNMIIEPLVINWKMLNSKIEAKAAQLAKNKKLLKMHNAIEAEYLKYSEFITTGGNEEEELAAVLGKIEDISRKAPCRIANVKPRATRKHGNYKEVSFVVTAEGDIKGLSHFLYIIEASGELLRVRHFAITPKSGSPNALKGTFVISKIMF